ncbi:MAG: phosphate-binding protein, partial [Methylococcales bacterium]
MTKSFKQAVLASALAVTAFVPLNSYAATKLTVDPSLPAYQTVAGISGNQSAIGSDTLANLMTLWAETFKQFYPNVNIQIQAAG